MKNTKITCEEYLPRPGERVCVYYLDGACELYGEFMCSEWIKKHRDDFIPADVAEGFPGVTLVGVRSSPDPRFAK